MDYSAFTSKAFINLVGKAMAAKKVLNISSEYYPYGKAEQFFELEVRFLYCQIRP